MAYSVQPSSLILAHLHCLKRCYALPYPQWIFGQLNDCIIFSMKCAICGIARSRSNKVTQKRALKRLTRCQTLAARFLLEAAKRKKMRFLLLQLRGVDPGCIRGPVSFKSLPRLCTIHEEKERTVKVCGYAV
ncbi:uncharacterized protein LOC144421051 [Styela clava]